MAVSQIGSAGTADAIAGATNRQQSFGQNEFLKMMLAQLKNQDPLKPLDPAQFLGQLAQFSTVTGIQGMQNSLSALNRTLGTSSLTEGASLIGRDVLTAATTARLGSTGSVSGAVVAPAGASSVQVNVRDVSGALVRRFDVPVTDGLVDFSWDGLNDQGSRAASGVYAFEALGRVGNSTESVEVMLQRRVNSVTFDGSAGGLTLNTSGGAVSLAQVRRVM